MSAQPVTTPDAIAATESGVPQVLFVCVHNAGRSQMAAALLAYHAAGAVEVRSAGSIPAGEINPAVRAVLTEIAVGDARGRSAPEIDTWDWILDQPRSRRARPTSPENGHAAA
jgi:protein-tyrosine-phosphatase